MKRYGFAAILTVIALQCSQFPSRYDRFEPDALRSVGFVYEPFAEGAPGDTLRVKSYFPGEKVVSVSWRLSFNHIIDAYGTDTILDLDELPVFNISSDLPDSIAISFMVPESTFFVTKAISSKSLDLLKAQLPPLMSSMTQKDMAAMLKDVGAAAAELDDPLVIAALLQRWGTDLGITTVTPASIDSLMSITGKMLAVFSVPAVIFAEITSEQGNTLRVKGNFTIRYNRRFQNTPLSALIPVNNNPKVRWMGVYKVKGKDIVSFNPSDPKYSGKYTLSYLYNEIFNDSVDDAVIIDTGYSYFLGADSGMVSYTLRSGDSLKGADSVWHVLVNDTTIADTSRDKYFLKVDPVTGLPVYELETFYYDWQFENLDLDSVVKPMNSLLMLSPGSETSGGGQSSIVGILPSLDTKMGLARIWVTVYDYYPGELYRPSGFGIRQSDIRFIYTDAYKQAHH
jgi:hypothetical protein